MLPSQIPGISGSSYGTPPRLADREPQQLHNEVKLALENALPGISASTLIHSLDQLLRGRRNYTIVGSTSMHLHAIKHPNKTCTLPKPNDIDVVASDVSVQRMRDFTETELSNLGLKRDENFAHVFHMAREGQADLKIDIVSDHTQGFKKYASNPIQIHGLNVGQLADALDDYRSRVSDREFIAQCGGTEQAKEKVGLWLKYFDQSANNTQQGSSNSAENMRTLRMPARQRDPSDESSSARGVKRGRLFD